MALNLFLIVYTFISGPNLLDVGFRWRPKLIKSTLKPVSFRLVFYGKYIDAKRHRSKSGVSRRYIGEVPIGNAQERLSNRAR